jgi:putative acetyltransferase
VFFFNRAAIDSFDFYFCILGKTSMAVQIEKYQDSYREAVINVWERSVRATHHFLDPGDIEFYKTLVQGMDFNSLDVYCAMNAEGVMIGIFGIAESKLEMLFLLPDVIGKGIGKELMQFILRELKVNRVDVNEGNTQAVGFYQKFGFKTYDCTSLDDSGKPYPILKMKLERRSSV